jgi:alpha-glucosidase
MQLLPYIRTEAAHCAATGEPLMRPLLLDNPDDPITWQIADQYYFGRDLLVAPVIEPGVTQRKLYLPRGEWRDLWDGSISAGGQWIVVEAPINRIPVFVRANAAFHLLVL